MLALAEYAHDDGTKAFPKVENIAKKARLTRKAVQSALRRLEENGHIVCTGQTKTGTNVYSILGVGENLGESGEKGAKMASVGAKMASSGGVVTTPDPLYDPSKDPLVADAVSQAWGKLSPPLIGHPEAMFKSGRFKTALVAALAIYEPAQIVKAIENYAAIIGSKQHYWNHRYTVIEFLNRPKAEPGLNRFVDEAMPFENFRTGQDRDSAGGQQATPADRLQAAEAWILTTAWRLPLEEWEIAEQLGQRGVEGPDRTRLLGLWRQKTDLAA